MTRPAYGAILGAIIAADPRFAEPDRPATASVRPAGEDGSIAIWIEWEGGRSQLSASALTERAVAEVMALEGGRGIRDRIGIPLPVAPASATARAAADGMAARRMATEGLAKVGLHRLGLAMSRRIAR